MIRFYPGETFREFYVDYPLKNRYAVSDRGRLLSFKEKFEDGRILKGGDSDGYRTFRYIMRVKGKVASKTLFMYRLIAEAFLPKSSDEQCHVLHLDHTRNNDTLNNLRWATYSEMQEHRKTSPHVIRSKQLLLEHNIKSDGHKLTVTKVIYLKKLLQDPNRKTRLKMLAKQFGISEMQVSRIKNGENWSHIKV